jgi:hypothetical protein
LETGLVSDIPVADERVTTCCHLAFVLDAFALLPGRSMKIETRGIWGISGMHGRIGQLVIRVAAHVSSDGCTPASPSVVEIPLSGIPPRRAFPNRAAETASAKLDDPGAAHVGLFSHSRLKKRKERLAQQAHQRSDTSPRR